MLLQQPEGILWMTEPSHWPSKTFISHLAQISTPKTLQVPKLTSQNTKPRSPKYLDPKHKQASAPSAQP